MSPLASFLLDVSGGAVDKNSPADAEDMALIPGPGRFPNDAEQLSLCAAATETHKMCGF